MTANSSPLTGSLRDVAGTIVLVGAGNMGSAMLQGWLGLGLAPERVVILDPKPSDALLARLDPAVRCNPPLDGLKDVAALVLAVKPQVAPEVIPGLASLIGRDTVAISIMAGKTIAFMEQGLPGAAAVRAMPNTPAAIGRGITVAVPNARVTDAQRRLTTRLLAACGKVEWVEDEALIDAVTAVSGSGPAYVFLMAESLARAGAAAGLPQDLAARLARETVAGAGELLHRSELEASKLRENVTSPAGTTAAALAVLMADDGLDPLLKTAVAAAARRSRELAG
ncbi:MAG: pyrroline-5-carboxylate reductase [Variibacter sp.]